MGEIEDPRHSRPIDVHRWSDHPEVAGLVDRIWDEHMSEGAGTGPKPKTSFRHQLRVLVLDLYVAWLEDPKLSIGVSMSPNAWDTNSRYNAIHLSKKLIPIIKDLQQAGLIDLARGSYAGPNAPGNRTTRIRASAELQKWFAEARFTRDDVRRAEGEEIIILRDEDDRLVEYQDTDDTTRWRAELQAYNALIASAFIDIPLLEEPKIEEVITDHHHKLTRRIFSRSDWRCNGRFYGGWWQRINSDWRSEIFINDTPVVEVDYRGIHVSMLCIQAGADLTGDPYEIEEVLLPGMPLELQRRFIKRLALTAINADSKDSAYRAFRDGFPTSHAGKSLTNQQLDSLLDAFLKKNPYLADGLFDDLGIRLMNLDAQITERVHRHFTEQGVPVLSVHDSYLIDYTRVAELKAMMARACEEVMGAPIPTSNRFFGLDEKMGMPGYVVLDYISWRQTPRCPGYLDRLRQHEQRTGTEVIPYRFKQKDSDG